MFRQLIGRLSNFRGGFKVAADGVVPLAYNVNLNTPERAKYWLEQQRLIYPPKPDTKDPVTGAIIVRVPLPVPAHTNLGQPGGIDKKRPFGNIAIGQTLAHLWKKGRGKDSIGEQIVDMLPRTDAGKPTATAPMIALACAALHSTLEDYTIQPFRRSEFEGVEDVYKLYLCLLEAIAQRKPQWYAEVLEQTLKNVSAEGSSKTTVTPSQREQEALSYLDLSD
uniref:DUF6532 domain-containing protein n=1 Tax=Mycena chlorophos TaxID=658473 RepID=A0ABQ0L7C9_MYCCL|nr:predicted protein [Mycena chlorophos]